MTVDTDKTCTDTGEARKTKLPHLFSDEHSDRAADDAHKWGVAANKMEQSNGALSTIRKPAKQRKRGSTEQTWFVWNKKVGSDRSGPNMYMRRRPGEIAA